MFVLVQAWSVVGPVWGSSRAWYVLKRTGEFLGCWAVNRLTQFLLIFLPKGNHKIAASHFDHTWYINLILCVPFWNLPQSKRCNRLTEKPKSADWYLMALAAELQNLSPLTHTPVVTNKAGYQKSTSTLEVSHYCLLNFKKIRDEQE